MALQGAHLFVLALWRESPMRVGTLVYEALLMVHLLLASVILREACANYAYVSLWSRSFCVPAIDASWGHAGSLPSYGFSGVHGPGSWRLAWHS